MAIPWIQGKWRNQPLSLVVYFNDLKLVIDTVREFVGSRGRQAAEGVPQRMAIYHSNDVHFL